MSARHRPTVAAQIDRAHPLARGLVGCWLFAEGAGSSVRDHAGGNHGALKNMAPGGWSGSHVGGALRFDGVGDHVEVPHATMLNLSLPFTLSFWLRYTTTGNLVVWEKNANSGFSVQVGGASEPGKVSVWTSGPDQGPQTTSAWNDDRWHHFMLVARAGTPEAYVDGHNNTTIKGGGSGTPNYGASTPVYFGGRATVGVFSGLIGHCVMWSRALSATDARLLATEPHCFLLQSRRTWFLSGAAGGGGGNRRRRLILGAA